MRRVFSVVEVPPRILRYAYVRVMLGRLLPRVFACWFRGFRFGDVFFFACNHSASPPGGNQVDGLPPA